MDSVLFYKFWWWWWYWQLQEKIVTFCDHMCRPSLLITIINIILVSEFSRESSFNFHFFRPVFQLSELPRLRNIALDCCLICCLLCFVCFNESLKAYNYFMFVFIVSWRIFISFKSKWDKGDTWSTNTFTDYKRKEIFFKNVIHYQVIVPKSVCNLFDILISTMTPDNLQ